MSKDEWGDVTLGELAKFLEAHPQERIEIKPFSETSRGGEVSYMTTHGPTIGHTGGDIGWGLMLLGRAVIKNRV